MEQPQLPPNRSLETHRQAVASLFEIFEDLCEGAIAVNGEGRIDWMNDKYAA